MTNKPVTKLKTPLTARERAERILKPHRPSGNCSRDIGQCTCSVNRWRGEIARATDEIEQAVKEAVKLAEREAREAGRQEGLSDLEGCFRMRICECGDKESRHQDRKTKCGNCPCEAFKDRNSYSSGYKEGFKAGFKSGAEAAAKVCEDSLLEHPSTIEESGWVECTKDPEVLAREIRNLPLPSASSSTTVPGEGKEI